MSLTYWIRQWNPGREFLRLFQKLFSTFMGHVNSFNFGTFFWPFENHLYIIIREQNYKCHQRVLNQFHPTRIKISWECRQNSAAGRWTARRNNSGWNSVDSGAVWPCRRWKLCVVGRPAATAFSNLHHIIMRVWPYGPLRHRWKICTINPPAIRSAHAVSRAHVLLSSTLPVLQNSEFAAKFLKNHVSTNALDHGGTGFCEI